MGKKTSAHCHHMVRDTAVAMAHECYDALMQRNDWYKAHREAHPGANSRGLERVWVNAHWGDFVEGARAVLAQSLRSPLPEPLKEQIAEALMLDNTLVRGRIAPSEIIGKVN